MGDQNKRVFRAKTAGRELLKAQHGADVKPRFLQRLASEVAKQGTLSLLCWFSVNGTNRLAL
jgi:hypothetical protein